MTTCIIVGAVNKIGDSASVATIKMLRAVEHEFPLFKTLTLQTSLESLNSNSVDELEKSLKSPSHIAVATACQQAAGACCSVLGDPKLGFLTMIGRIFSMSDAPTSLLRLFERYASESKDIELCARKFLGSLDGQYALALRCGDSFLLARDPMGAKPLYVAENKWLIAFSTMRRPLWTLGLTNCISLPHSTLLLDRKPRRISLGMRMEAVDSDENSSVESLTLLLKDVIKRIGSTASGKIAILFSGGLDSAVIAKLSKDLGLRCTLYCAGTASSRDMVGARRMSSALGFPLVEREVTYDDVAAHLIPVAKLIESIEMIAVSTSLPIYFAIRECAASGEKTVMYGQGADELFGGYQRYEDLLVSGERETLCDQMLKDVVNLGTTAPMYDQIARMQSTELLAPFLDPAIVKFSLGIPLHLKLHADDSRITRKYILRRVAQRIGVPVSLLPKQKVAIQFGSGVAKILDKVARDAGYKRSIARRNGLALPIKAYLREIGKLVCIPPQEDRRDK